MTAVAVKLLQNGAGVLDPRRGRQGDAAAHSLDGAGEDLGVRAKYLIEEFQISFSRRCVSNKTNAEPFDLRCG